MRKLDQSSRAARIPGPVAAAAKNASAGAPDDPTV